MWIESGFLEIVDYSNKAKKYKLVEPYDVLAKKSLGYKEGKNGENKVPG